MFFDDDLLDFGDEGFENTGAYGAVPSDFEADAGSGAGANSVSTLPLSSTGSRRKRGSRGGAQAKTSSSSDKGTDKRWRSGAISAPPAFDGDIEADPFCFRHYKRRLKRWVEITREYLPPNEQALRALECLRGEAEVEMEEIDDSRYNVENGIELLLQDLEASFGAKELFRQGGVIREFESLSRLQGESVAAFIRRFRLLERRLQEAHVDPYPEPARVVKLLDALRLDERSTSQVLLAAGNRYELRPVLDALKIQYPAGMSLTGIPRNRVDTRGLRGRGRASTTSSSSTASGRTSRARGTAVRPWKQWHTQAEGSGNEDVDYPDQVDDENNLEVIPEDDGANQENVNEDERDEDVEGEGADWSGWADQVEDLPDEAFAEEAGMSDLAAVAQALTVTSKKLANLVQARGYYNTDTKGGKSKGKGKSNSKGKGKGKPAARAPGKSSGKGSGKGSGKLSKGRSKGDVSVQQQRIQGSLCLGCGSSGLTSGFPRVVTWQSVLTSGIPKSFHGLHHGCQLSYLISSIRGVLRARAL